MLNRRYFEKAIRTCIILILYLTVGIYSCVAANEHHQRDAAVEKFLNSSSI